MAPKGLEVISLAPIRLTTCPAHQEFRPDGAEYKNTIKQIVLSNMQTINGAIFGSGGA